MARCFQISTLLAWCIQAASASSSDDSCLIQSRGNLSKGKALLERINVQEKAYSYIGVSMYRSQQGLRDIGINVWHMGVFFVPIDQEAAPKIVQGHQCSDKDIGKQVGKPKTAEECSKLVADEAECGPYFMFSESYPSWGCKCCGQKGGSGGVANSHWDIYRSAAWVDRWFEENCDSDWLSTQSHSDGLCATADGSSITPDHDIKWLSGQAFEATYSNGQYGKDYDQTFALGPPGRYIEKEGSFSNVIWEGHAKVQYSAKTTVTLEMFVKAIQEQSFINNNDGTYSWETNNCQDFTNNVLHRLHLDELIQKIDPHRADLPSLIAAGAACTVPGLAQAAERMGWCGDAHRGVNPQCLGQHPHYSYDGAKLVGPIKQCLTNDCGSFCYANFNPLDYKCKKHTGQEAEWNACKSGYHPDCGSMASCHCKCKKD